MYPAPDTVGHSRGTVLNGRLARPHRTGFLIDNAPAKPVKRQNAFNQDLLTQLHRSRVPTSKSSKSGRSFR
jgi:hypothetical protein